MVYRGFVLGLIGGGCIGDVSENMGEDRGFLYGKEILELVVMRF